MESRPDVAGNLAAVAKIASIDKCLHGTSVEQKLMLLVPASDGSGRVPGGLGRSKFDQIAGFQDYDVKGWTLDSAPYLGAPVARFMDMLMPVRCRELHRTAHDRPGHILGVAQE